MGEIKNWREFLKDVPTDVLLSEVKSRKEEEAKSIKSSPLAIRIMKDLDYALKRFGTYTFGDKGPHEVMDISNIMTELKSLPSIKDIATILSEVLDNYTKFSTTGGNYEASYLVNTIIGEFDYLPEEEFDELFTYDERFQY